MPATLTSPISCKATVWSGPTTIVARSIWLVEGYVDQVPPGWSWATEDVTAHRLAVEADTDPLAGPHACVLICAAGIANWPILSEVLWHPASNRTTTPTMVIPLYSRKVSSFHATPKNA